MKQLVLTLFTALFLCFIASPAVPAAEVNEFEIVVADGFIGFEQAYQVDALAKSSNKPNNIMSQSKTLTAAVAKIKQDKLDQRRTVLSKIDQEFVDETVKLGIESGVAVDKSIVKSASKEVQKTYQKASKKLKTAPEPDADSDGGGEADETDPGIPTKANTKAEIQSWLTEHKVEFETDANKDALLALVAKSQ